MPYPHLVFGGGYIGTTEVFNSPQSINDALGIVKEYESTESITEVDTAHIVYQANYSAFSRKPEMILFPLLRKLSMSIYVYSPLSGGFLSKTRDQIMAATGRFDDTTFRGGIYVHMYRKPVYLDALDEWNEIARSAGCTKADLAYRWMRYHSFLRSECGDAVLFATSSLEQLRSTMDGFRAGPLSEDIVQRVNRLWESLEAHAPGDTFEAFQSMVSAMQA
ncbi:hypothetical protein RU639_013206 [Aspergillus parasiticus]